MLHNRHRYRDGQQVPSDTLAQVTFLLCMNLRLKIQLNKSEIYVINLYQSLIIHLRPSKNVQEQEIYNIIKEVCSLC